MTAKQKICYRGSDGDTKPVECTYEDEFGYPNYCTNEQGEPEKMYVNTHFRTKEEAWNSIVESAKAGVSISTSNVVSLQNKLAKAERELLDDTIRYQTVISNLNNTLE